MQSKDDGRSFFYNYLNYFVRPSDTFAALLTVKRRVRFATFAVLVPAIGYTLMYALAWVAGGAPSSFRPWLAIPILRYFKWNIFIVAPSMFLCWVLSSGAVRLLAPLFGGKGRFEDTATAVGFGIGVATWSTLLHDLTDAVLGAVGVIDMKHYEQLLNQSTFWRALLWTLFAIYFVWFIVLFSRGFKITHRLKTTWAVLLALISLIIYQGVFLVFNR